VSAVLIFAFTLAFDQPRAFAEADAPARVISPRVMSRELFAVCGACRANPADTSAADAAGHLSFQDAGQPLHAAAVEHSDAYRTRARVHKIASFATLPLFAAELALGQSIYNTAAVSDSRKSAHIAVGAGIMALFGVNTITGAWNLFGEDRQDPKGRGLRWVHAILMMVSDA